jgi:hypothetical protein
MIQAESRQLGQIAKRVRQRPQLIAAQLFFSLCKCACFC